MWNLKYGSSTLVPFTMGKKRNKYIKKCMWWFFTFFSPSILFCITFHLLITYHTRYYIKKMFSFLKSQNWFDDFWKLLIKGQDRFFDFSNLTMESIHISYPYPSKFQKEINSQQCTYCFFKEKVFKVVWKLDHVLLSPLVHFSQKENIVGYLTMCCRKIPKGDKS